VILIDREIRALLRQGDLKLDPFDDGLIQPTSIDLRLDALARVLCASEEPLDTRSEELHQEYEDVDLSGDDGYVLGPRDYLLVQTYEHMQIPATCQGRIAERSSLVRLGLSVMTSLINPGYAGRLPCTLTNLSGRAIRIYAGVPFCQLVLHRCVGRPDVVYHEKKDAKYHDEPRARPSALPQDVRRWHPAPRLVHPEQVSELKVEISEDKEG
jgi:dCTP deaminase